MSQPKRTAITLMAGESFWSKLIVADTKFKTDGEFTAVVRIPENSSKVGSIILKDGKRIPKASIADILKVIDTEAAEALDTAKTNSKTPAEAKRWETKYLPYKYVEDDEGNRTGEIEIKATMKASGISKKTGKPWSMEPKLFDAFGRPIKGAPRNTLRIGNGSVLVIAATIQPYAPTAQIGASVKLSLEAVQIIELCEGGADASTFGFGSHEGGFASHEDTAEDQTDGEDAVGDNEDF